MWQAKALRTAHAWTEGSGTASCSCQPVIAERSRSFCQLPTRLPFLGIKASQEVVSCSCSCIQYSCIKHRPAQKRLLQCPNVTVRNLLSRGMQSCCQVLPAAQQNTALGWPVAHTTLLEAMIRAAETTLAVAWSQTTHVRTACTVPLPDSGSSSGHLVSCALLAKNTRGCKSCQRLT